MLRTNTMLLSRANTFTAEQELAPANDHIIGDISNVHLQIGRSKFSADSSCLSAFLFTSHMYVEKLKSTEEAGNRSSIK